MSATLYYIFCAVLSIGVLFGIAMMSKVKTAVMGNAISATSVLLGIFLTLFYNHIFSVWTIYAFLVIGVLIGATLATRVKMIQMPQMVALLNGIGGFASACVGVLSSLRIGSFSPQYVGFTNVTATLAMIVGSVTLFGSLIAAGKLHKLLPQKPVIWKNHTLVIYLSLILLLAVVVYSYFANYISETFIVLAVSLIFSFIFGIAFSIRVGGADMPITISLLNSLSGVAGAIAGMAVSDILLVAVGGIVGASGLLLTQIMCRSMNRKLLDILTGKTSMPTKKKTVKSSVASDQILHEQSENKFVELINTTKSSKAGILRNAKSVIIVPGYGMALAQAQHQVRQLADLLESRGAEVKYAIHPVAGRMPGHMNVLLAEADVPYEKLYEMDSINDSFSTCDAVIVIGANDVLNPSARDAEGTPIYGMPVLNVDHAKHIFICNFDTKPGYSGVDNPLYHRAEGVYLYLGDAKETVSSLIKDINQAEASVSDNTWERNEESSGSVLKDAKSVIIVPGYGMALAQAQHQVRQLADLLESRGAEVKYAIHPVAGRMPGHMNVLLAEADVPYEKLYEMDSINDSFSTCDAVIVIGANDVLNPSARDAEGTPIYGMPVLNVDHAKHIFICNFDTKPGYSGVDNPLYHRAEGVYLYLGDAKESLNKIMSILK